ncbi:MAG: type II toxin-antitoxin system VapC family toxin [Pseudomonadales bacterium]
MDNSIAMRWLLASEKKSDQTYAEAVLKSLVDVYATVSNLWHLEATNVLIAAEKRGALATGDVERFIAQLESLPIQVDPMTAHQAFSRTLSLSKAYKLSSYDAAYLELAIREGLPIATLEKDLLKAAKKADVTIYLK